MLIYEFERRVTLRKQIINMISMGMGILVFMFLVKGFYFDTKMGFETKILELNYSALPMFIDVIVTVIIVPILVYGLVQQFGEFVMDKVDYLFLSNKKDLEG